MLGVTNVRRFTLNTHTLTTAFTVKIQYITGQTDWKWRVKKITKYTVHFVLTRAMWVPAEIEKTNHEIRPLNDNWRVNLYSAVGACCAEANEFDSMLRTYIEEIGYSHRECMCAQTRWRWQRLLRYMLYGCRSDISCINSSDARNTNRSPS